MTTTPTMITSIVAGLKSEHADDTRSIKYHPGRLDEKTIQRYQQQVPALIFTWLGHRQAKAQPTIARMTGQWAIFIVTKDTTTQPDRHIKAQTLADAIVKQLAQGATWGVSDASRPTDVRSENLFSEAFDRGRLAVYVVTWEQSYDLTGLIESDYVDLDTVYAEWELEERDEPLPTDTFDAEDQIDLPTDDP